jgi:hypothetical protein
VVIQGTGIKQNNEMDFRDSKFSPTVNSIAKTTLSTIFRKIKFFILIFINLHLD